MDEQDAPPAETTPQPVAATPAPPEQPPTTAPAEAPATDRALLAAFTQKSQTLSAVATALGLAKTSTTDQFLAAITDLKARSQRSQADAELEADPRLAAQAAALRAREATIARQQFGETADLAATLLDAARSGASFIEVTEIVNEAVLTVAASRFAGASPAQAGGTPAPQVAPEVPQQAPERQLIGEIPGAPQRGTRDLGFKPEQGDTRGYFAQLMARIPGL